MKDLSRPQNLNSYFEILVGNSCIAVLSTTSSLEFLSDLELPGGINQSFKEPAVTSHRKGRSLKGTLLGAKL